jgi:hypothetical protein
MSFIPNISTLTVYVSQELFERPGTVSSLNQPEDQILLLDLY